MTRYGVRTAYGTLERVLMHRPGAELRKVTKETLREFNFERLVDVERFQADYDAMQAVIESHAVEVVLLGDVLRDDAEARGYMQHRPNLTYTRDLAAVFASGAVLMSPHLKGRRGDEQMMARAFRRLGVPILGAVESPGYLEGGGVTLLGDDTAIASVCDRANQEGTRGLRDLVLGRDVKYFLDVPLPHGHIHIDGIFMVLDERLCLIYEESLNVFPCRLHEAGRTEARFVMFPEFLDQRGFTCLPITLEERLQGHLNVVITERSRRAVGFAQAVRVGEEMTRHGFELATFPSDELFMGRGGAHCMTCPLLVR